jgi:CRP/FNR family transcriptional regulator
MSFLLSNAHRDQWNAFLKRHRLQSFEKGEIILLKDVVPAHAHIVKSGIVKTYSINENGDEQAVSYDSRGDVLPIGWVFKKIDKTTYFYKAFTDCELYLVPREEYVNYLRRHPKLTYDVFSNLAGRFVSLQDRIFALEQPKASDKLIYSLVYLIDRFGVPARSGNKQLAIPLTQNELANYIGLTRETVSIELGKLSKKKIVKLKGRQYIIDITRLNSYLDEISA